MRWVALHTLGGAENIEFSKDKAALAATIERFAERFARQPPAFRLSRHPIFGGLNEWEWMGWGYLHADHYFRQFGV